MNKLNRSNLSKKSRFPPHLELNLRKMIQAFKSRTPSPPSYSPYHGFERSLSNIREHTLLDFTWFVPMLVVINTEFLQTN